MQLKPIKHGIKVFALCCSFTTYLPGFQVQLGMEYTEDGGSAVNVVDRLIADTELTKHRGQTLYTDNWYTSTVLTRHLFENYVWTLVGTITPTDKRIRQEYDVLLLKLSNGTLKEVERGWFCEAIMEVKAKNGLCYCIQCSMQSNTNTVMCHVKGKIRRVKLAAPNVQPKYVSHFNAVDQNDHDSADYTHSMCSNPYFLQISFG